MEQEWDWRVSEEEQKRRYWNEPLAWELVEMSGFAGVQYMTHDEIVSSVLMDMLNLHFGGWGSGIPWYELFRFLKTEKQRARVLEALLDPRVQELIVEYAEYPQIIRLKPDHDFLQRAMNIAGLWFEGFEIPEGVTVISLTEKGEDLIKDMGVEGAASFLAQGLHEEERGRQND